MAMQQTNSSFAKKLGARVAQANAEHKDKPIDTGSRRLPAGVKAGVAKLQFMYTKEQDREDGKIPKGENFFRASAVVLGKIENGQLVKTHNGETIEGAITSLVIPLCDIPAKGDRKAVTFSENWFEFQNVFKLLSNGSIVCTETPQTDPTGQKTEAFYFSAMSALTNPKHPIHIEFSTRGWTPPKSIQKPNPEEMVFETWHGLVHLPAATQHNPSAGVTEGPPPITAPNGRHTTSNFVAPPTQPTPPPTNEAPTGGDEGADIDGLIEMAMSDPSGATPDGAMASQQLEEMAWENGWTKEQTGNAADWRVVGEMARNGPATVDAPAGPLPITVGSRWMYAKRTKEGVKYKDGKGQEFPPQECEVVSVNDQANTVTLKTVHDGKDVVDLRGKKPVDVKFEWLEQAPPY